MMIRPATKADIPAISAIWNLAILDSLATFNSVEKTAQDLADMLKKQALANYAFLVAEHEKGVNGFGYYSQFRGGAGYRHAMEHSVYIDADAKGQGIGRAVMMALEDHARDRGAHVMMAGVSAENPAGITFHERLGYTRVARIPEVGRKFDRWLDLILLQKRL